MANSDVTEPLKPTMKTSVIGLCIFTVLILPLVIIAYAWVADIALKPEDAKAIKTPLFAILGWAAGAPILGAVASHLIARWGKVSGQLTDVKGKFEIAKAEVESSNIANASRNMSAIAREGADAEAIASRVVSYLAEDAALSALHASELPDIRVTDDDLGDDTSDTIVEMAKEN